MKVQFGSEFKANTGEALQALGLSSPKEVAFKVAHLTTSSGRTLIIPGVDGKWGSLLLCNYLYSGMPYSEVQSGLSKSDIEHALSYFGELGLQAKSEKSVRAQHPTIDFFLKALEGEESIVIKMHETIADGLQMQIEDAWEKRDTLSSKTGGIVRAVVETAIAGLDDGVFRTAAQAGEEWIVNQWLKKAVLLSFRLYDSAPIKGGAVFPGLGSAAWFDKVPLKTHGWDAARFAKAGFRAVPGSIVRRGSFIDKDVVLMPSFVNIGAYVGHKTMVDTWATVGSCAQIGRNCHLSDGVGIGGVLEPIQANPVIIEDNCFIGARSEVVEGVIVGTGSVLSMGVFISATTKIVDRATGQIHLGKVPPYSVVVPGNMGGGPNTPSTYCAVIMKTVDERTRSKTSINELLRD